MLSVREVAVEVRGRVLLEGATFTVRAGDKVGLVGRNGAGKTSLLRVLSGQASPHRGEVERRGAFGYLLQEARSRLEPGTTALDHVLAGKGLDEQARRLEKARLAVEEDPTTANVARFSRVEDAYANAEGYRAEAEVRRIAAGLGVPDERLDLPLSVLSGGERRRVELARILFAGSDLLFLDEPTNHLDIDAKTWLMGFLRSYRGGLLVVSHDLELLDAAITRVLHLDEGALVEYRGTYSQYRAARAKDEDRRRRVAIRQQAEIHRLSTLADSMRHSTAKRARIAKSLDKRVERLEASVVSGPAHERSLRVRFPSPPRAGRVVLEVDGLAKSYGGPDVFTDVSFEIGRGDRLLVMGLNGAGKTSLLRIIAGESEPTAGSRELGFGVSLGYYAQEHEGITPGVRVLDHMQEMSNDDAQPQELRSLLGMFGLSGEIAFQDAGTLSGGEKTRLALAQLVAGRHNLLLLDEPTNNLDPPSRTAVARSLSAWPGAMVIVSHDTAFVRELAPPRVLMMPDGTLDYWDDGLLDLVALA
jgi:ATPase subunit of ABC transporter with duplicated ATPase domains